MIKRGYRTEQIRVNPGEYAEKVDMSVESEHSLIASGVSVCWAARDGSIEPQFSTLYCWSQVWLVFRD